MIKGKCGQQTPMWVLATIILGLVSFGIVAVILYSVNGGTADDKADGFCSLSNTIVGSAPEPAATGIQLIPKGISPQEKLRFCPTQLVSIKPDEWRFCDDEFKKQFDAGKKGSAVRNCAAQQIANLILRCWEMGGSGSLNPGSWVCFNVEIDSPDSLDYSDFTKLEEETVKELESIMGCRERLSNSQCKKDADAISGLVINRSFSQSVIDFYTDSILSSIELCYPEPEESEETESPDADKDGVADNQDACPNTPREMIIFAGPNGCAAEEIFAEFTGSNKEQIQSVLSGKVDTGKVGCGNGLVNNIVNSLKRIEFYEQQIAELDSKISLALQPYQLVSSDIKAKTIELGSRTPGVNNIDKEFITALMQDTKIKTSGLASDRTYCQEFPCKSRRFDMDIELESQSTFEIGFCDPPQPVGVGPIARVPCDLDEDGFGRQRILIAPAGQGITRTHSPVPDMCSYLPITSGVELVLGKEICKPFLSGIFD